MVLFPFPPYQTIPYKFSQPITKNDAPRRTIPIYGRPFASPDVGMDTDKWVSRPEGDFRPFMFCQFF
jgi:hypothetical protein